jgi:HK97 family phage major capsid protein
MPPEIHPEQLNSRALPITPASYTADNHSVQAVALTENPVQVIDWERYALISEVILIDGVELPANNQVPLLDSHDRYSVESVLGSVRDFEKKPGELLCRIYFSQAEEGASAETKVAEGHVTDLSAGYKPLEKVWIPENTTQIVAGRTFTGPLQVCTRTLVKEVSLTPIGADEFSKVRSAAINPTVREVLVSRGMKPDATEREAIEFLQAELQIKPPIHESTTRKETPMPPELTPEQLAEQERQRSAEAVANERARVKEIDATAAKFSTVPNIAQLRADAVEKGTSVADFFMQVRNAIPEPVITRAAEPEKLADVKVFDFKKPWQVRSVKLLHAMVHEYKGRTDKARALYAEVNDMIRTMGPVQLNDELREAHDTIVKSGIPQLQQYRLMSSLTTGAGAATVPTPLLAEIFTLVEKWGVARRYFRPIPMTQDTLKLSSIVTHAIAYWVTQGANGTINDLVFAEGTMDAAKLMGLSVWTSELDEDAAIAMLPLFVEELSRAIYQKEDLAGFIGDGTVTYGSFTGILNVSTNIVTMAAGKTAFSNADLDDFKTLRDAVNIDYREGAMYFLSPATVSELEGQKDLQNNYQYRPPAAGMPAMLWGFPIADTYGINALTITSAAATKFAAFGNPKHMLMGMRRELDLVVSREGIVQAGDASIAFNALQADGAIVRLTERIAFKQPLTTPIAVLKTATA